MLKTWPLEFLDGSIELIQAPSMLIQQGNELVFRCDRIRLLQELLGKEAHQLQVDEHFDLWPFELADEICFSKLNALYQKIADLLYPVVDVAALIPESRHRFFICQEPLEINENRVAGLSGLEFLMGYEYRYEYRPQSETAAAEVAEGSGAAQNNLELLADMLSIHKGLTVELAKLLAPEQLVELSNRVARNFQEATQKADEQNHQKGRSPILKDEMKLEEDEAQSLKGAAVEAGISIPDFIN